MKQTDDTAQRSRRRRVLGIPVGAWLFILIVLELPLLVVSKTNTIYISDRHNLWIYNCDDEIVVDAEYYDDWCGRIDCKSWLRRGIFTERRIITVGGDINMQLMTPNEIVSLIPKLEAAIDDERFDFGTMNTVYSSTGEVEFAHAQPIHRILWFRINAFALLLVIGSVQFWLLVIWIHNLRYDIRQARCSAALIEGRCPHCSYDLHGLSETRCPECGETWAIAD